MRRAGLVVRLSSFIVVRCRATNPKTSLNPVPQTFPENPSRKLAPGHDLGSGRLMHGGVSRIRDPGLLVHHRKAPTRMPYACEMIEPPHRTIVEIKGEAPPRPAPERTANSCL